MREWYEAAALMSVVGLLIVVAVVARYVVGLIAAVVPVLP